MPATTPSPAFDFSQAQVAERLKAITIDLIRAHRHSGQDLLDRYAGLTGLWDGPPQARPPRLFMKLIQVYHPDRLAPLMAEIAALQTAGDASGLEAIKARLQVHQAKPGPEGVLESADFSWDIHPGDMGFGEKGWDDHEDGARLRKERQARKRHTISVVEAMRREHFGNLDIDLTRHDLEEMDGDLELADLGIESLAGLQLCRYLTGLNLSLNHIHDINPIRALRNLAWLDLSGNEIEDADCLEKLTRLEELDLSDNDLDDIDFLLELPRLKVVNLSGNPIRDRHGVRDKLTARGIMVVG